MERGGIWARIPQLRPDVAPVSRTQVRPTDLTSSNALDCIASNYGHAPLLPIANGRLGYSETSSELVTPSDNARSDLKRMQ